MRFIALALSVCAGFAQGPQDAARVIRQVSHGENSPNISNVSGSVTITYNCTVESSYRSFPTEYTWPPFATSSIPVLGGGADSIAMWDGLPKSPGSSIVIPFGGDGQMHVAGAILGNVTDSIAGLEGILRAPSTITFTADGNLHLPDAILRSSVDSITALNGLPKALADSSVVPFSADGQWHLPGTLLGSATDSIAGLDGLLKPIGASTAITFTADGNVHLPGNSMYSITALSGLPKALADSSVVTFSADGQWHLPGTAIAGPTDSITVLNGQLKYAIFDITSGPNTASVFAASSSRIPDLVLDTKTGATDWSKLIGASATINQTQFASLYSTGESRFSPYIAGIPTVGMDWSKVTGAADIISGTDTASLSKTIADLSAAGNIITAWAVTYHAAEPR